MYDYCASKTTVCDFQPDSDPANNLRITEIITHPLRPDAKSDLQLKNEHSKHFLIRSTEKMETEISQCAMICYKQTRLAFCHQGFISGSKVLAHNAPLWCLWTGVITVVCCFVVDIICCLCTETSQSLMLVCETYVKVVILALQRTAAAWEKNVKIDRSLAF